MSELEEAGLVFSVQKPKLSLEGVVSYILSAQGYVSSEDCFKAKFDAHEVSSVSVSVGFRVQALNPGTPIDP